MAQVIIEKRRYAILKHLHDTPGNELMPEIIKAGCRALGVVPTDDDEVQTALAWLEANGLIRQSETGPFRVARLTQAGRDVVTGYNRPAGIMPFGDLA